MIICTLPRCVYIGQNLGGLIVCHNSYNYYTQLLTATIVLAARESTQKTRLTCGLGATLMSLTGGTTTVLGTKGSNPQKLHSSALCVVRLVGLSVSISLVKWD